jgi:hypothetical protein
MHTSHYRALGGGRFNQHFKKELLTFRATDFEKNKNQHLFNYCRTGEGTMVHIFVPYSSTFLWMVFSFVTLYWFVGKFIMGPLVVLLVLLESPQKADVHDCYFTIFKSAYCLQFKVRLGPESPLDER